MTAEVAVGGERGRRLALGLDGKDCTVPKLEAGGAKSAGGEPECTGGMRLAAAVAGSAPPDPHRHS